MEFKFCSKQLTFYDFFSFLLMVEQDFVPPLLERIDVREYYEKINSYATLIECFFHEELVGLFVLYDNDIKTKRAFCSFLAVKESYRGNKIAKNLLQKACLHAKEQGMEVLNLYTNNEVARDFYIKNGFKVIKLDIEERYKLNRYYLEKKL